MDFYLQRLGMVALLAGGVLGPSCVAHTVGDADADPDASIDADADAPEVVPEPSSWLWNISGTGGRRYANAVIEAEDGGVYVGGYDDNYSSPGPPGWVGRFDASGVARWEMLLDGWVADLAPHPDGGVVVVGGYRPGLVAHLGPDGAREWMADWQHEPGQQELVTVEAIRETPSGTFVLVGILRTAADLYRAWIAEMTAEGALVWQRTLHDANLDHAARVTVADSDILLASRSHDDAWLIRLDPNGVPRWARHMAVSPMVGWDRIGVVETSDADVVLVSTFHDGASVLRFDAAGSLRWQRVLGRAGIDFGTVALPGSEASIVLGGIRMSGNDLGPDLWLAGVDADGALTWQEELIWQGCEAASDAVTSRDGTIIVATGGCEHAMVAKLDPDGGFDGNCDLFQRTDAISSTGGLVVEEITLAPEDTDLAPTATSFDAISTTSTVEVLCQSEGRE